MSYIEDSIDWQVIEHVDAWLDRTVSQPYQDQPLAQDWARLSKVAEELQEALDNADGLPPEFHQRASAIMQSLGRAVAALIGATGQNPRKGITHTRDEVVNEVLDAVLTGLLCSQHLLKSSAEVRYRLREKQAALYRRAVASEQALVAPPEEPADDATA